MSELEDLFNTQDDEPAPIEKPKAPVSAQQKVVDDLLQANAKLVAEIGELRSTVNTLTKNQEVLQSQPVVKKDDVNTEAERLLATSRVKQKGKFKYSITPQFVTEDGVSHTMVRGFDIRSDAKPFVEVGSNEAVVGSEQPANVCQLLVTQLNIKNNVQYRPDTIKVVYLGQ